MSWSPDRAPHTPARPGWSGPAGPGVRDPVPGWQFLIARLAGSDGIGGDLATLLAHLLLTSMGRGRDTAQLAGFTGTEHLNGVDMAALAAHLIGIEAGHGSDGASWMLKMFAAFTDENQGLDSAGLRAHLIGLASGQGRDLAGIRAMLTGRSMAKGGGTGSARFSAMSAVTTTYSTAGSFTYQIPGWATQIDIIWIGGGASGQTGNGAINSKGSGGASGTWSSGTLYRGGVDWPSWSASTISVVVGEGGAQPGNSDHAGPNNGSPTTIIVPDYGSFDAPGGTGTISGQNGGAPGNHSFGGVTYTGGSGGTGNGGSATTQPGGGGAGGNGGIFGIRTRGGYGARGRAYVIARQEYP